MTLAFCLTNDTVKLPVSKRQALIYILWTPVDGLSLGRSGGLRLIVGALFTERFFREVFICQAGNIALVYVAVECGGADSPLTMPFHGIYNNIYRQTLLDETEDFRSICVITAELNVYAFTRCLIVSVILCDLCRVAQRAAAAFCTHVRVQTTLDLTRNGGGSKAELPRNKEATMTSII